jgi:hypothetical protein
MRLDQIVTEAMRLSSKEKALLAESLWESLGDPFLADETNEEAALKLAEERDREINSGEVKAISHKETMRRLPNDG